MLHIISQMHEPGRLRRPQAVRNVGVSFACAGVQKTHQHFQKDELWRNRNMYVVFY